MYDIRQINWTQKSVRFSIPLLLLCFYDIKHAVFKGVTIISFYFFCEVQWLQSHFFFIKSHFSSCNETFQFVRWLTWAAVFTLSRRSIFLIPWVLESEVRTSSGASGALGAPLSPLQQMRGSAGCEMAVVIAPRPRGLQPIHSPVSSLIEPVEIGDEPTVTEPPRPSHC